MEFLILGPIEVRTDAGPVELGGIKPRAVLAVLLLHPNEPVSAERLALALWGEDAAEGSVKTVQVYISRLRKALGDPAAVTTTAAGYSLRVLRGELDSERFEDLVEEAREIVDAQPEEAGALLREALALWRGPALAELALEPFVGTEIARLEEQRLAALELRIDADLAASRHAEVVGELAQLVVAHPIRERFAAQLMLALYRCGRQTEALEAYARARRVLVAEVGVEPGPELRDLHEAILRQDVALAPQPVDGELPAALDTTPAKPLAGRDDEVAWLQSRWSRARAGSGAIVAIVGPAGVGKSRLAAELASAVHGTGAAILHATGKGPADSVLVALRRMRDVTRPTLLVVDDADLAGAGVQSELERLASAIAEAPVLIVVCARERDEVAHVGSVDTLALEPLDAVAVRDIALRYAPGRPAADVPADWLHEASGGVPRRIHDVAGQWARREAARHVGAVADRAEAGRAELRSIEEELAGGLVDLQETRERLTPGERAVPIVCPFKGLASYDVGDAPYFFGRERLVAELVARLVGGSLLGVVGPSGSGKSSALRAGLLPALASGVLPGSDRWRQVLIRPGSHPVRELGRALDGSHGEARVVLAVDQFEETFTVCEDESERAEFVAELVAAASEPGGRYVVVLALRADFYGRCAAYPQLAALLAASNVLVGSMQREELRRAIEQPAQRAGLRVEPELVDALVADVENEPGGLPLLSTSLLELWQHRDGRRMRHAAYERMGGVRGAVARLAEEAYGQLGPAQQEIARTVLMRLVDAGDGEAVERRRVALEELEIERDEDVARVVALLTDRRLLTVSAGTVELAHEALLREWPRLRGWVEDDRDGLRIRRGVSAAAREWEQLRRDDGALYRGSRLIEAIEWRDARKPPLTEPERDFLDASFDARERERVTRRRRTRLMLGAAATIVVASVAVAVAATFAHRQSEITASRDLATQSATTVDFDPGLALEIARSALGRHDTPQAQSALRQAALADRATGVARAHKSAGYAIDVSPDGRMLVSAGDDGKVGLWRAGDLHPVRTLVTHSDLATSVAFTPDGDSVASLSVDGTVALTPTAGGRSRTLRKFPEAGRPFRVDAASGVVAAGTKVGTVWVLPTAAGARARELGSHGAPADVVVAISPDGKTVFSADSEGKAFLWDVDGGGRVAVPVEQKIFTASFSRDGRRVVAAGEGGHVGIWDASTGAAAGELETGASQVVGVRFSADGRRMVTVADDHVVKTFDVAGGREVGRMAGGNAVRAVFTAGGKVASVGSDGKLRLWTPLEVHTPGIPTGAIVTFPSFSPDDRRVVVGDHDSSGNILVWNRRKGGRILRGSGQGSVVTAFLPDQNHVVSASAGGPTRVYDVPTGASSEIPLPSFPKYAVAASTTGLIAVAGDVDEKDGAYPIVVARADGRGQRRLVGHTNWIVALAFSRDAKRLASGGYDGTLRIWDLQTGKARPPIKVDEDIVHWVAWDDDGKHIATAGGDGTIRVWPVDGGDPVVLTGHDGPVNTAMFNSRGDRIVSTGLDGTVRVWSASGGDALVVLDRRKGGDGTGAAFSADDRYVVSSSADGIRITRCEACDSFDDAVKLADSRAPIELSAADRVRLGLD